MIVRRATRADYPTMFLLVEEFFKANTFAHLELDIDVASVTKLVEKLTTEHLMLVLETDCGIIIGGTGGLIVPFLFNTKIKIFQELFSYVQKDYRKYSQLLLCELKKICQELKLNMMIMGYPSDGKLDKMERYYQARGFKKLETHFIKRI